MADTRYFENIETNFSKWSDPYDVSQGILLFERLLQKVSNFEQAIKETLMRFVLDIKAIALRHPPRTSVNYPLDPK